MNDDWTLGLAASAKDSAYAGEGVRIRPFPLVSYKGERVHFSGVTLGLHLLQRRNFTLDAVVSGRFDGFDSKDLGRLELERNGVDIDRLADRDPAADAGFEARWTSSHGDLRLRALADITDVSGGYELSAQYGYRFQLGKTTVIPGIGVRWMSDDLADYYYGIRSNETFSGASYQPGSALVPEAGVVLNRALVGQWRLHALLQYQFLPDALADSPLLERDSRGVGHLVIGMSRSF